MNWVQINIRVNEDFRYMIPVGLLAQLVERCTLNRDVAPPGITRDNNYHFVSIIKVQLNISITRKVLPLHFC